MSEPDEPGTQDAPGVVRTTRRSSTLGALRAAMADILAQSDTGRNTLAGSCAGVPEHSGRAGAGSEPETADADTIRPAKAGPWNADGSDVRPGQRRQKGARQKGARQKGARQTNGNRSNTTHQEIASLNVQTPEDPVRLVRAQAMSALARREYARVELRRRLLQKCADVEVVDTVLHELQERGLQCDHRFAASFLRYRAGKGYGPIRIRQELAQRGAGVEVVEQAFQGCGIDWRERAEEVRQRKFRGPLPETFQERARQFRFLSYRGFDVSDLGC